MSGRFALRRVVDRAVRGACLLATVLALLPLVSVLAFVVVRGAGGLSLTFLSGLPKPVGEPGGGMSHDIVGSLQSGVKPSACAEAGARTN